MKNILFYHLISEFLIKLLLNLKIKAVKKTSKIIIILANRFEYDESDFHFLSFY